MTIRHDGLTVEWLGYAGLRLESPDGTVVYVDPGRYGTLTGEWRPDSPGVGHPEARDYRSEDGDLVLVTNDHHYDSDGIRRVAADDATLVVYEAVYPPKIDRDVEEFGELPYEAVTVDEEDDLLFGDAIVRSVAGYNEPDGPHTDANGEPFHPEGFGVGYHLTLPGRNAEDVTVFWPGDSDALPGHAELDVSLFCPPIGGSFTMDREDAAELAGEMDPTSCYRFTTTPSRRWRPTRARSPRTWPSAASPSCWTSRPGAWNRRNSTKERTGATPDF